MYCTCGKQHKAGYTAMPLGDYKFNYDLWVCANCHMPSQLVFKRITNMHAPRQATAMLSLYADGHGRQEITWAGKESGSRIKTMVFHPYPKKVDMTDQGRDILVQLWHRLDSLIDMIRGEYQTDEVLKGQARALADVIALIMSPFYEDSQAVLRESMTRWQARQAGTEHDSPGLAEAIWNPLTRWNGTPYEEGKVKQELVPQRLDDQKRAFIKHCLDTGSMSPEDLAGMFSVSVEVIKANVE